MNMNTNFKDIKYLIYQRWFQILILFGIFILLVQPKINISTNTNTNTDKEQSKQLQQAWFKDYNIYGDNSISVNNNTHSIPAYSVNNQSQSPKQDPDIQPIYNPNNKVIERNLEKNKAIIKSECIRIEPDLNDWTKLNYERKNLPTLDYIIPILEREVGYEYLYSDVERAVRLIMKKIGR